MLMAPTDALHVDPTNTEQLRAWDGDEGAYWAAHADRFDRGIAAHHRRFMEAAGLDRRDRVLDVGCGTGQTTRDAARGASDGAALGVDLSAAMLDVARRRAADERLANVRFEQADAQLHAFEPAAFDVALGRTSAMFFGDRVAALANVGRALRPGGRLVLLTWQPLARNGWIQAFVGALATGRPAPAPPPGAPGPFSLAEPEEIRAVMSAAGYVDVRLEDVREPMWFGADAEDATQFVLGLMGWMLADLDDTARATAVDALRRSTAAHADVNGVRYASAAWIIRATRP
jgi:SAM-dependent methyltransferase